MCQTPYILWVEVLNSIHIREMDFVEKGNPSKIKKSRPNKGREKFPWYHPNDTWHFHEMTQATWYK